jgi:hypothetical protein
MDPHLAEQLLDELLPTFEAIDTQSSAVLEFLKTNRIAREDQLAPFLEQAKKASTTRWRALRLRVERLLSLAERSAEGAESTPPKKNLPAGQAQTAPSQTEVQPQAKNRMKKPNEERVGQGKNQGRQDSVGERKKPAA